MMDLKYKDDKQKQCLEMLKSGDLVIYQAATVRVAGRVIEYELHAMLVSEGTIRLLHNQLLIDDVVEIFVRMPEGYVKIWGNKPW